jgi:ligand-binding sensor domain-containing protein
MKKIENDMSALLIMFCLFVFHSSCGQLHTNSAQDNFIKEHNGFTESQLKELANSKVPRGQVRKIRQDRNGNILIAAAWGGVFRYDGKNFTNLTSNTVGMHRFWDVLQDRQGNLWFATTDSGAYMFNGKSFQHFTTKEGLPNNSVMCIFEDKAGIIWFGTGGGGISRYDGKSFRNFTMDDGITNNDLTTIMEDKSGKLWIGTRGEAFVYDGNEFAKIFYEGKTFNNVWSIIEDNKGNIWFGSNDGPSHGLWRYDGNAFTKVSKRGVYAVIEDKKGNIWTTGRINSKEERWALSRYDQKSLYSNTLIVTKIISGPPAFLGILEAPDGSIWFGSAGWVHRYDGKTITDFNG